MAIIDHFFMPPPLPWEKPIMEYPLIVRTQDGSKSKTVFNAAQEAAAAECDPPYKRRSLWPPPPPPVVLGAKKAPEPEQPEAVPEKAEPAKATASKKEKR